MRAISTAKTSARTTASATHHALIPRLQARPAVADVEVRRHLRDAVIQRDARGHEQQERQEERECHHPHAQPDGACPGVPQPAGREHEQHQDEYRVPQHVEEEQRDGQPRVREPMDEVLEHEVQDRVGDEQRPDDVPRPPHPEQHADDHLGRQCSHADGVQARGEPVTRAPYRARSEQARPEDRACPPKRRPHAIAPPARSPTSRFQLGRRGCHQPSLRSPMASNRDRCCETRRPGFP